MFTNQYESKYTNTVVQKENITEENDNIQKHVQSKYLAFE